MLYSVRDLIDDPVKWTQQVLYRDKDGKRCWMKDAESYCIVGAVNKSLEINSIDNIRENRMYIYYELKEHIPDKDMLPLNPYIHPSSDLKDVHIGLGDIMISAHTKK